MHHIIKKRPFNLPALMITMMQEASSKAKPMLPYGIFLTLVFREFGVSLKGEPSKRLQHFNTYNEKLILEANGVHQI